MKRVVLQAGIAAGFLWSATASAQSATPLDRFDPAPAGDTFMFVPSPDVLGGLRPSAAVALAIAKSPLVLVDPRRDDPEIDDVVSHQLVLHGLVGFELFHRLKLELDVPVTLDQDGSSPSGGGLTSSSPSGAAMNDIRLGARVSLLPQQRFWPAVGASMSVWFPSGNDTAFTSSGSTRLAPALVIGADYDIFVWSTTVGRRFDTSPASNLLGSELLFGIALGPRIGPVLVSAELWGTTVAERGTDAFSAATTNLEFDLGVRYALGPFAFRVGGGPGLTTGVGTPDYRFVAMIGYEPDVPNAWKREQQTNRLDAAFDKPAPGPEPAPRATPKRPRPLPPSDGDADGVVDTQDACPEVAGPPTGARPGCPPDGDGDGVADRDDACPQVAGARHPDPKRDGCPPDTDGDGILDSVDACVEDKGAAHPDPTKNGCPDSVRVVGQQIVILERVEFQTGKADLLPTSESVLQQVAAVMIEHPDIIRLAVEGHTDNVGREKNNIQLSQARALTVMRWLIDHGVDERRLEARGYGPRQPLTDNDTPENRAKNRRVEFRILKRDARGEAAWTDGGVE